MTYRAAKCTRWPWHFRKGETIPQIASKHHKGQVAYHGGMAAEQSVERQYRRSGYNILARRWRGAGGEIDLVFKAEEGFVFVEVKKANTFEGAALRVSPKQRQRIFCAASEFVASQPLGQLSHMRFDLALVDRTGQVSILENALYSE